MEFADFNGFVLKGPCPECNSELVYHYDDHEETQHYHVAECSKVSCKFSGKYEDEEVFNLKFGGLADKQQCGAELLDLKTIASIDRLTLDVQQLQSMVETMKNCANCAFWFGVGRPCEKDQKALPIMLVCSEWKLLGEEEECAG